MGILLDALKGGASVGAAGFMEGFKADILAERDAALANARKGERATDRAFRTSERLAGQEFTTAQNVARGEAAAASTISERKFTAGESRLERESKEKIASEKLGQTPLSTPPALLSGLDPEVSRKADAAYIAAGGGDDGVKALNEQIKVGTSKAKTESTEIIKKNVARISELAKGTKTRESSAKKARKFLRKFEAGDIESGTTRRVAGWVPGIWSTQGQFDEEFDAFAEVAAREKLKAVGEIRPTDADVEGMKKALFGKNRDEETNINLLNEFIFAQESLDDELDALRGAKKRGELSTFTGVADLNADAQTGEEGSDILAAKSRLDALRAKLRSN